MQPPVSDPPDSDPDAKRRSDRRRQQGVPRGGRLDFAPRPIRWVESRPNPQPSMFDRKRRLDIGLVLAAAFGLGTLAFVALLLYRGTRVEVDETGLEDGDAINADEAAELVVTMDLGSEGKAAGSTLSFDGEVVEEPHVEGSVITWRPADELDEGEHALQLSVPRPVLGDAVVTWDFTVDATPPEIDVPSAVDPVAMDERTTVTGTVERGAALTADGQQVDVDDEGHFSLEYARPPAGPIVLDATDRADNTTTRNVVVPVTYPATRGVHVSGPAWDSDVLRNGILQLVDEGRIDTVVLDLKDEGGTVHYDSQVPRAREIGAVTAFYDLDEAVATLRDRGVHIIGRIAAFRDPRLAQAAWGAGQGDQVIQAPDQSPYGEPAEFTNFANPSVRQYNIDIALEAVERGVGDILWDDARRPTGDPASMVIPGLTGSPSDAIVRFLAEAHAQLRRRGAYQGVTTVGVAAEEGDATAAQDVPRMAQNADYVAPLVFPGYWSAGRYDVPNPPTMPGDLALRLTQRYAEVVEGRGAVLTPWLQDFSVGGVGYGEAEVRAQIAAALQAGAHGFLLWDTAVSYTGAALDPAPPPG